MAGMIDDDILNIGSAKWNAQFQMLGGLDSDSLIQSQFAPTSFMLPAAENVRVINVELFVISFACCSTLVVIFDPDGSRPNTAEHISLLKRVKIMAKKFSSLKERLPWLSSLMVESLYQSIVERHREPMLVSTTFPLTSHT
jgi:hypothetical protein